MKTQVTTYPAAEPVSLTRAKLHLRVDHSTDDELIKSIIAAARQYCEGYQNRAYMVQTITLKMDEFPCSGNYNEIIVPRPPLISVSSIKYIDTDGDEQTVSSSVYDVDIYSEPGRIGLAYGQSWPGIRGDLNGVEVIYTAGYMTTFTAADTDELTLSNAIFSNGDKVRVETDQNDLPDGLSILTDYYVGDVSGLTCKLYSDSDLNNVVDIEDAGTGTHYIGKRLLPERIKQSMLLIIGHLYEHREENTETVLQQIPMGAAALLSMDKVQWI